MSNLEDCIVEESILNAEIRNFVFYVLRLKFTLDIQVERLSNQLDLDQVQTKLPSGGSKGESIPYFLQLLEVAGIPSLTSCITSICPP